MEQISIGFWHRKVGGLTQFDIMCIQRIFVLSEAEAIHEFDSSDFVHPIGIEVGFYTCFRYCWLLKPAA